MEEQQKSSIYQSVILFDTNHQNHRKLLDQEDMIIKIVTLACTSFKVLRSSLDFLSLKFSEKFLNFGAKNSFLYLQMRVMPFYREYSIDLHWTSFP